MIDDDDDDDVYLTVVSSTVVRYVPPYDKRIRYSVPFASLRTVFSRLADFFPLVLRIFFITLSHFHRVRLRAKISSF